MARILIVDDSKTDIILIKGMLKDYEVLTANNGKEAIDILQKEEEIDLIILDINMPIMNGFEVLKVLQNDKNLSKIKVIILTNYDEIENEIKGLRLGAVDYIRKPVNIESLKIRIGIHLELATAQKIIERDNQYLDALVNERTVQLEVTRYITINALVRLLEVRNIESHNHSVRTRKIMRLLCDYLKNNEGFSEILTDEFINDIVEVTPLHDIGKVGIPDEILLKPGKLSKSEFDLMKKHVDFGVKALVDEVHGLESTPIFLQIAIDLIQNHHERFDGTGYPNGLKGKDIPLAGRLMAIVDVYDAMMNKRVYKPAFDNETTTDYIKSQIGKHFDPEIVKAYLTIKKDIHQVIKDNPLLDE